MKNIRLLRMTAWLLIVLGFADAGLSTVSMCFEMTLSALLGCLIGIVAFSAGMILLDAFDVRITGEVTGYPSPKGNRIPPKGGSSTAPPKAYCSDESGPLPLPRANNQTGELEKTR